ncbi:MAG: LysM peptidoglycan-binding domain-containing protein [Cytophagales bacterium]
MRKQVFAVIAFFLCSFIIINLSQAQDKKKPSQNVKIADSYFENQEYYLAADYYGKEIEENPNNIYANYQLAECYRYYYDYENAEKQYSKTLAMGGDEVPLVGFWYAMMLKSNGKYELSKLQFDSFLANFKAVSPDDRMIKEDAELERDGCILALKELKKPIRNYEFVNLPSPVNTPNSEYAPNFYEGDTSIVFASARQGTKGKDKDTRLGEEFSDLFRFKLKGREWSEYPDDDDFSNVNTVRNDGAGVFTKDLKKFYYTSCIEKDYPCAIYVSTLVDGKWTEGVRLNDNINRRGYETKQPTLTAGGDTMIFVSDRPDGRGQNDLWFSRKRGDESWLPARNMGNLNTKFQDIAPFYDEDDSTLFFASNGRQGFGGLDIYKAQGAKFEKVTNMGLPFNTNRDEFYLSIGKEKGLLSSNREGGKGNDDIYYFNIESKELLLAEFTKDDLTKDGNFSLITNLFYEPGGEPAVDIPVLLTDANGNTLLKAMSDELGSMSFEDLSPDQSYKLVLENNDDNVYADVIYKGKGGEFNINAEREGAILATITKEIIERFNSMSILSKLSYANSGDPAADVSVVLVDDNGLILKRGKTNMEGIARFQELDSDKDYRILIDEEDPRLTADIKFQIDDVRIKWMSQETTDRVVFENIYFDFNDFAIRKEAKKTLDDLASYLKSTDKVQVEIYANTDNLGTDEYNQELAKKRGIAVVSYLENNGVDKSSIVVNAVGANKPIASNETPIGRQLNRRVEFYVVGGSGYNSPVMTYIVEPKQSLEQVASEFNMTPDELKKLNNIGSDTDLRAFIPLRVRKTGDNGLIAPISMASASSDKYKGMEEPGRHSAAVVQTSGSSKTTGTSKALPDLPSGQSYHIVKPLETLFRIAYSYGMTVKEIKELNNISSEIIQIGDALKVTDNSGKKIAPGPGTYVVKDGDTLYDIAVAHKTTVKKLIEMNNLDSPVLYQTMVLRVE